MSYAVAEQPCPLYRNAIGDECIYVEAGSARLESAFGTLELAAGDYVIMPTSVVYRLVPTGDGPLRTLVIEATGHIGPPKRYLSVRGQFLEHSPYCERDLRGPAEPLLVDDDEDVEVYVQHRVRGGHGGTGWTKFTYAHHPFDVVGWDGCLYPWALSIHDFEPITGRVHQPPPVHQTFEGPNFVICSFVPRKVDYHPLSIPVPYNHHNVDSDEMLFYTGGNYEARKRLRHRTGFDLAAPVRLHPRAAARRPGAGDRRGLLRRAGRHGGHVPAAGPVRAGPVLRGHRVRLDLGAPGQGRLTGRRYRPARPARAGHRPEGAPVSRRPRP